MKRICILLNGSIKNDARVIRIIRTFSDAGSLVDLYYVNGESADRQLFDEKVSLFSFPFGESLKNKVLRHSFFFWEFNFFIDEVLGSGRTYSFVYANDLPTLYPAYKISRKLGCRLVYDSHEIYTETLNQFFPAKASGYKKLIFRNALSLMKASGYIAERFLCRKADVFITVNNSCAGYFKDRYGLREVKVLVNAPELKELPARPAVDFRELYHWKNGDRVFLYQGVLTYGKGLELLVRALKDTPDHIKLVLLGDGFLKASLLQLVKDLKLSGRVGFHEKVPAGKLMEYTIAADFGINFLEDINLSKKYASNNKMFEYMHARIPLLSSASIENIKIHTEYEIGLITEMRKEKIAEGLILLAESPKIKEYKESCHLASLRYNWNSQATVLTDLLKMN